MHVVANVLHFVHIPNIALACPTQVLAKFERNNIKVNYITSYCCNMCLHYYIPDSRFVNLVIILTWGVSQESSITCYAIAAVMTEILRNLVIFGMRTIHCRGIHLVVKRRGMKGHPHRHSFRHLYRCNPPRWGAQAKELKIVWGTPTLVRYPSGLRMCFIY